MQSPHNNIECLGPFLFSLVFEQAIRLALVAEFFFRSRPEPVRRLFPVFYWIVDRIVRELEPVKSAVLRWPREWSMRNTGGSGSGHCTKIHAHSSIR